MTEQCTGRLDRPVSFQDGKRVEEDSKLQVDGGPPEISGKDGKTGLQGIRCGGDLNRSST